MKRAFSILIVCLAAACAAGAQPRYSWKDTTVPPTERPANNPRAAAGVEIYTRPGTLIVKNPERVSITVLTILGQTISQATIAPGTHELTLGAHGIYIVKVGDTTLRVAL